MDQRTLVIVVVAVVVVVIAALLLVRKQRSDRLKRRFGSEYDQVVRQQGDPRRAEAVLEERQKRVEKFPIRPLPAAERELYEREWMEVQRIFVDNPSLAVVEADGLLGRVMAARGYPTADFEQRAADVSVHYPGVVQNYRSARDIVVRHGKGQTTTEDLRRALVYFRSLFDELLDAPKFAKTGVPHERAS